MIDDESYDVIFVAKPDSGEDIYFDLADLLHVNRISFDAHNLNKIAHEFAQALGQKVGLAVVKGVDEDEESANTKKRKESTQERQRGAELGSGEYGVKKPLSFPVHVWRDQYFSRDFLKRLMIPTFLISAVCCMALLNGAPQPFHARDLLWGVYVVAITLCMIFLFLVCYYLGYKPSSIVIDHDIISVTPIRMLWFSGGWSAEYRVADFDTINASVLYGKNRDVWTITLRGAHGTPDLKFEPPADVDPKLFASHLGAFLHKKVSFDARY